MNVAYGHADDTTKTDDLNEHFHDAGDNEALLAAFEHILSRISGSLSVGNVTVSDGLTTDATTSTLVSGQAGGFRYTVTGPLGELYSVTAVGSEDNPTVTFTINGQSVPGVKKTGHVTRNQVDSDGNPISDPNNPGKYLTVTEDKIYYSATVGNTEYKMALANIDETGQITWDLSAVGTLLSGYSYNCSFVVWPDQDAYDYVASLNNGLESFTDSRGVTVDVAWDSSVETDSNKVTDSNGKSYWKGGVSAYPSIVKYTNGIFAVLTNTNQSVTYSIVDTKTDETTGETETTYDGPYEKPLEYPDPMPLTGTASQLEKVWNIKRDPSILYKYLYESRNDNDELVAFDIGFAILQDGVLYKEVHLPGAATVTGDEVTYDWSAYDAADLVEYNGKTFSKRWSQDFSIPTGLMLSKAQMEAKGLDKNKYPSYSYNGTTYYVLEEGHDFQISELSVGYEFDFEAPAYHPMLVDGVLMDVKFSTEDSTKTISSMEALEIETGTGKSALSVFNTLRGYINLKKKVVDQNGNPLDSDDREFTFEVELTNPRPVFEDDSIPWYGINNLYYHDAEGNYYQAEYVDGELQVTTEYGGPYPASGNAFNPDIIDAQDVTYIVDGEEKSITIYGNQMSPSEGNESDGYKKVTTTVKITQSETLYIANVPVNTQYTVQELTKNGYQLVNIARSAGTSGTAAGSIDTGIVEGKIVPNAETLITYTNKCLTTDITIQKLSLDGKGLQGAVFQLKEIGDGGKSATLVTGIDGLGTVTKTVNGSEKTYESAFESNGEVQVFSGLPDGTYRLYEVYIPDGYISTYQFIQFTLENSVMKNVTTDTGDVSKLTFKSADGNSLALLQIKNEPGVALPSTGGSGTRLFMILGSIMTLGAVVLLWMRRRSFNMM